MFCLSILFILTTQLFPATLSHRCLSNQFRCLSTSECLRGDEVCDNWPDCIDSSDESISLCGNLQNGVFPCNSGDSTKFWQVCDGVKDCSDGSDETEDLCRETFCHINQFKCKYGACLHSGIPCDGIEDCMDGSDEDKDLCEVKLCNVDQFRCSNGKCIGMKEVCDTVEDCIDGADEAQWHCQNITKGLFNCGTTTREYWRVCDGVADCTGSTDETLDLCDQDTCHGNQFQCDYGACLYNGHICDGVFNCADESDESNSLCASQKCESSDFRCNYGACLSRTSVCDGKDDCKDKSDELQPYCQNITNGKYTCWNGKTINAWEICDGTIHCSDAGDESEELCGSMTCHSNQFKCKYGACLASNTCDGSPDCLDQSDETEELCSKTECSDEYFRCNYGACIHKILACNGKKNCVDGSDENFILCQNNTCLDHQFHCANGGCIRIWPCVEEKNCTAPNLRPSHLNTPIFRCSNGDMIPAKKVCDEENDCFDKSDEDYILCNNLKVECIGEMCDYTFPSTACNGIQNCLDWSDESFQMCNSLRCMLPHYPEHGTYNCSNTDAKPGDVFQSISLTVFCDEGFAVKGSAEVFCNNGTWSAYPLPQCIRYCTLDDDPSISYRCLVDQETGETRPCRNRELTGTVVLPTCNGPNYYSLQELPQMTCVEGTWNEIANCSTECGKVTPVGVALIANGTTAQHGEIPWYAGIYEKKKKFYQQICGGTLVNRNVVISAAHCFWGLDLAERKEKVLPAKNYAVAVGKLYRQWNNQKDVDAQKSDVTTILVPQDYEGGLKNHQADIAVLILTKPFDYKPFIRPICLSFDPEFDENQLKPGSMGKIAGWGLTAPNSTKAKTLQVVELPFVDTEKCNDNVPAEFREFITLDKFCAGYLNEGTAVCMGDSGSGIAFPETFNGVQRYFLRGIASVSPRRTANINDCNIDAYTTMTSVFQHRIFIKKHF